MHSKIRICIVDSNDDRRTRVEEMLREDFIVSAFARASELAAAWPEPEAAFVADENGHLMFVWQISRQREVKLPIIAFGEGVDIDRAISTIYVGALDFIDLDRHPNDLPRRLELALRRRSPEFEARLRALHSSNLLAELDDDLRRILSLFARGHDHEKICQVMALPTAELEVQIDEIKQKLRVPSLMDAMRMIID